MAVKKEARMADLLAEQPPLPSLWADAFDKLADRISRKPHDMPAWRTREEAGELIIAAHRRGFLFTLPGLAAKVAWHTSPDDRPEPQPVQARYAKHPSNLLDEVAGLLLAPTKGPRVPEAQTCRALAEIIRKEGAQAIASGGDPENSGKGKPKRRNRTDQEEDPGNVVAIRQANELDSKTAAGYLGFTGKNPATWLRRQWQSEKPPYFRKGNKWIFDYRVFKPKYWPHVLTPEMCEAAFTNLEENERPADTINKTDAPPGEHDRLPTDPTLAEIREGKREQRCVREGGK